MSVHPCNYTSVTHHFAPYVWDWCRTLNSALFLSLHQYQPVLIIMAVWWVGQISTLYSLLSAVSILDHLFFCKNFSITLSCSVKLCMIGIVLNFLLEKFISRILTLLIHVYGLSFQFFFSSSFLSSVSVVLTMNIFS